MAMEGIKGVDSYQVDPVSKVSGINQNVVASTQNTDMNMDDSLKNVIDDSSKIKQIISQQNESKQDEKPKSLSELRKQAGMSSVECKFGFDDDTNRITVKILDKDTKEVIREVPSEQTLEMIAKVWEMAGILVDEKL